VGAVHETLLYDLADSTPCLKARICLQMKGVPFRRVTATLGRRRQLARLNPLGTVPVLVDREIVIVDSSRIARHLEAAHPEPVLIPSGREARAYATLVEQWADGALAFLVGALRWLNPANRAAAIANGAAEIAPAPLRPLVGRILARREQRRWAAWGYGPSAVPDLEERLRENLGALAALLDGKVFLLGRTATLADVAVLAQITDLQRYEEARLLAPLPDVQAWIERLAAVPAIGAALSS
jgi:glutathione S-transferase